MHLFLSPRPLSRWSISEGILLGARLALHQGVEHPAQDGALTVDRSVYRDFTAVLICGRCNGELVPSGGSTIKHQDRSPESPAQTFTRAPSR